MEHPEEDLSKPMKSEGDDGFTMAMKRDGLKHMKGKRLHATRPCME